MLAALLLFLNGLAVFVSVPDPLVISLSLVGALVPALFYTALVLSLDCYEREPWRALAGAFGWGALVAALLSGIVNGVNALLVGDLLAALVGAPLVEETFKGVALLGMLLVFRREFDNVLDGLVYGALIGMGFEMTEDVLYLGGAYLVGGVAAFGEEWLLRPVLTGPAHAMFTGATGAAVGWARSQHGRGGWRYAVPVLGWTLAVLQHFVWNAAGGVLLAALGDGAPVVLRLGVQVAVLMAPAILTLYLISRLARGRERRIMREELADEVGRGVLRRAEYEVLWDDSLRRRAVAEAGRAGGAAGRAAQRRFFQAAAELAFCKHHHCQGEPPEGGGCCPHEDLYRAQLAAARATLPSLPRPDEAPRAG